MGGKIPEYTASVVIVFEMTINESREVGHSTKWDRQIPCSLLVNFTSPYRGHYKSSDIKPLVVNCARQGKLLRILMRYFHKTLRTEKISKPAVNENQIIYAKTMFEMIENRYKKINPSIILS